MFTNKFNIYSCKTSPKIEQRKKVLFFFAIWEASSRGKLKNNTILKFGGANSM